MVNRLIHWPWGSFRVKLIGACRFWFRDPCWDSLLAYLLDLELNRRTKVVNGTVGGEAGIFRTQSQLGGSDFFETTGF